MNCPDCGGPEVDGYTVHSRDCPRRRRSLPARRRRRLPSLPRPRLPELWGFYVFAVAVSAGVGVLIGMAGSR